MGNRVRFRFSTGRGASLASYNKGVDVKVECQAAQIGESGLGVPQIGLSLGSPAPRAALDDVGVMEESVEQRGDGGVIPEEFSPVIDGPVRGEDGGGPFVAAHDELQEIFGGGVRELAHAEVIDDEQGD